MPTFEITEPESGRVFDVTGDSPPTEQELEQIFASMGPQARPSETPEGVVDTINGGAGSGNINAIDNLSTDQPSDTSNELSGFPGAGVIEPAAAIITAAIAEPLAGLAGIGNALEPFQERGAGARTVANVREQLTFKPRTEAGQAGLAAVGEALSPVTARLKRLEEFQGQDALERTGSPALAAAGKALPVALLQALGFSVAKGALKVPGRTKELVQESAAKKAVVEAAPTIQQLKDVSRSVYAELDNSGVSLKPGAFEGLVNRVSSTLNRAGLDKDVTPQAFAAVNRLKSELGTKPSLTQVDTLRSVAQNVAGATNLRDARLGSMIIDSIDDFLDKAGPSSFNRGQLKPSEISPKYQVARELWGRARRSELINDAFANAKNQASGFENGLVVQFRSILNNKKKSRFFKPGEIKAMEAVVRGTTKGNIAKLIGRLGFSEGHATNLIGGSLGVAAGAQVGGPIGAVAVPLIGQVSRKLAQKLTRKNSELADTLVRVGPNAEAIAKAYIKNTKKAERSSAELSELLMRPGVSLEPILSSKSALFREAAETASGNRSLAAAAAAAGALQAQKEDE